MKFEANRRTAALETTAPSPTVMKEERTATSAATTTPVIERTAAATPTTEKGEVTEGLRGTTTKERMPATTSQKDGAIAVTHAGSAINNNNKKRTTRMLGQNLKMKDMRRM